LVLCMYVFGIVFTASLKDSENEDVQKYFGSLGSSMLSLLCNCVLLDDLTAIIPVIRQECGEALLWVYFLFMVIASFTLLNMLLGVLCEVVSETASYEGGKRTDELVDRLLRIAFKAMDDSQDGLLTKREFEEMEGMPGVQDAMLALGVDERSLQLHMDKVKQALFGVDEVQDVIDEGDTWMFSGIDSSEHDTFVRSFDKSVPGNEKTYASAFHPNVAGISLKARQTDKHFWFGLGQKPADDPNFYKTHGEEVACYVLEFCADGFVHGREFCEMSYNLEDEFRYDITRANEVVVFRGNEVIDIMQFDRCSGMYGMIWLDEPGAGVRVTSLYEEQHETELEIEEFVDKVITLAPNKRASNYEIQGLRRVMTRQCASIYDRMNSLLQELTLLDCLVPKEPPSPMTDKPPSALFSINPPRPMGHVGSNATKVSKAAFAHSSTPNGIPKPEVPYPPFPQNAPAPTCTYGSLLSNWQESSTQLAGYEPHPTPGFARPLQNMQGVPCEALFAALQLEVLPLGGFPELGPPGHLTSQLLPEAGGAAFSRSRGTATTRRMTFPVCDSLTKGSRCPPGIF